MGCLASKNSDNDDSKLRKKVVMVGLDNAGKTSILNKVKTQHFMQTAPTVGLNIETITFGNLELLIFDIGGRARSLWSHYYENLDALVFVVDSTDRSRLANVREEFIKLNDELRYKNSVVLVLFNKQDETDKLVDYSDLLEESGVNEVLELDTIVQKCSAKTGEGLIEGFEKLTNMMFSGEKTLNKTGAASESFRMSKILK